MPEFIANIISGLNQDILGDGFFDKSLLMVAPVQTINDQVIVAQLHSLVTIIPIENPNVQDIEKSVESELQAIIKTTPNICMYIPVMAANDPNHGYLRLFTYYGVLNSM